MMSRSLKKIIRSLHDKKNRTELNCFLVEGAKSVTEVLKSSRFEVQILCYTEKYAYHYPLSDNLAIEKILCKQTDLEEVGTFQSNDAALAVVSIPQNTVIYPEKGEWILALDDVRDPGNLGTIIRIADWYNITKIICSTSTADCYNPKVIAASMGSFVRVQMYYCQLSAYLQKQATVVKWGATMSGVSIYSLPIPNGGILVMGNEAHGLQPETHSLLDKQVAIPRFGNAESLNVAVSTAILCDNIRRKIV